MGSEPVIGARLTDVEADEQEPGEQGHCDAGQNTAVDIEI